MTFDKYFAPLLLAAVIFIGSACENIALIRRDSPVPEGRRDGTDRGEVVGTVDGIDTKAREIYVRTSGGQMRTVSYSSETRVFIRGQEYPVSELRRDDEVSLQLVRGDRRNEYTNLIRVGDRGPASTDRLPERSGDSLGVVQTIEGTVERVDVERGYFEVRPRFGNDITRVFLPYKPVQRTEDQFRRLREGDYVRVEGEVVSDNRVELKAFH
jgi:hypothetical protein